MGSGSPVERLWVSRLRWRVKGAWLWPAFVVLTVVDGIVLDVLPFYGAGPGNVIGGILLAGFANLALVAVVAPLAGRRLRLRRPDLPRAIAADYAGTALICALAVVLVIGGLIHRPDVLAEEDDRRAQFAAVHDYVIGQAPAHRPGLPLADSMRIDEDVYRTCVPGPDPKRPLCLFVDTDQSPPGVRVDSDRAPNAVYRRHGGFD